MNKLAVKHKNPIKSKKQQLINRINSCKTLKELKAIEKTLEYYPVLSKDYDWDYEFLIDLIEFKLKRMFQYFHSHQLVENENWYGTLCDRAVNILHAGYKTNIIETKDLGNIYVNMRNKERFVPCYMKVIQHNQEYLDTYEVASIREEKAKVLFWKFLHHYIEVLWG